MASNVHVVPDGDAWAVRREGAERISSRHSSQEEAIAVGTLTAQRERVELLIHGRDGQIRERNSFGNDPRDIPG